MVSFYRIQATVIREILDHVGRRFDPLKLPGGRLRCLQASPPARTPRPTSASAGARTANPVQTTAIFGVDKGASRGGC